MQPFPFDDPGEDELDDESDCDAAGGEKGRLKDKGRRKPQPKPQAFPMPTQMLASIGALPKGIHQKRISEGCSDDERQAKKKRRSSLSYVFMFTFQCHFRGSDLIGSDLVNIFWKTKAIQVRTPLYNTHDPFT